MKKSFLKRFLCVIFALTLFLSTMPYASALESSKSKKTGYHSGQVIKTETGNYVCGRINRSYTKAKDIYVSETVECDKLVKDLTSWSQVSDTSTLGYSQSVTISGSGSVDVIKKMGLKASISISKNTAKSYVLKPNAALGKYCRVAAKADFFVVKYKHVTYDKNGKQTGSTLKTLRIPIKDSGVIYLRYTN